MYVYTEAVCDEETDTQWRGRTREGTEAVCDEESRTQRRGVRTRKGTEAVCDEETHTQMSRSGLEKVGAFVLELSVFLVPLGSLPSRVRARARVCIVLICSLLFTSK